MEKEEANDGPSSFAEGKGRNDVDEEGEEEELIISMKE